MNFLSTNLDKEFESIIEFWSPKVVGELNGQYVKIAKLLGEFVWHDHKHEDEFFYVYKGSLMIELEDSHVKIMEGEFYIVPKSVRHNPIAKKECWVLLFEPKETKHTGDVEHPLSKKISDQIT